LNGIFLLYILTFEVIGNLCIFFIFKLLNLIGGQT